MRIVLINPSFSNYRKKRKEWATAPLSLGYLASYLISKGFNEVHIIDADAKALTDKKTVEKTKALDPDLIAFSVNTPGYFKCAELAKKLKKIVPKANIVFGGYQPTVLAKKTLQESKIDFVIIGEGEITFYELVKMLDSKKNNFEKINGLGFKKNKKIVINPPRKMIKNLDELPFPARHLMPNHLYKCGSVNSSRGCPYNCNFCYSPVLWGSVRFRSPKNVVDEIEEFHEKYNINHFSFTDDTFTFNQKRAINICREIIKRKIDINWICWARADTISEKLIKKMKKAGCYQISLGIESGNQKILNSIGKKTNLAQIKKAVKIISKQKIRVRASFIIGNINETKKEIIKTINFAKKLDLFKVVFNSPYPLPKTKLFSESVRLGLINKPENWIEYTKKLSEEGTPNLSKVSNAELKKLNLLAYKKFYLRPKYLISVIKYLNCREISNFIRGIELYTSK